VRIQALYSCSNLVRSTSFHPSVVQIPNVYPELSGEYVIVMDLVEGVPLSHASEIVADLSSIARGEIAQDLFLMVVRQVLGKGIFHADLHPGNIVVSSAGRAGLVDFGAVGFIDKRDRRAIALLLMAFDSQNSQAATAAILELLGTPSDVDLRELQREIGQIMLKYGDGRPGSTSAALFGELIDFVVVFGFPMPTSVATAFRAISTLEGSIMKLDPSLNLLTLVTRNGKDLLRQVGGLGVDRSELTLYFAATVPQMAELPTQVARWHFGCRHEWPQHRQDQESAEVDGRAVHPGDRLDGVDPWGSDPHGRRFRPAVGTGTQAVHVLRGVGAAGGKYARGAGAGAAAAHGLGLVGVVKHDRFTIRLHRLTLSVDAEARCIPM